MPTFRLYIVATVIDDWVINIGNIVLHILWCQNKQLFWWWNKGETTKATIKPTTLHRSSKVLTLHISSKVLT